jgi:hypothetical protein
MSGIVNIPEQQQDGRPHSIDSLVILSKETPFLPLRLYLRVFVTGFIQIPRRPA